MASIAGIPVQTIGWFAFIIVTQILGGVFLPKTDAMRNFGWTLACLGSYGVSIWAITLLISRGVPLNFLLPLMAAVVPLTLIIIGVVVYGEAASWSKLVLLMLACVMIGYAGSIK